MPSVKMKFSGVTILQGVEFSIFPIDLEWALQQCSATALPVMADDTGIHVLNDLHGYIGLVRNNVAILSRFGP